MRCGGCSSTGGADDSIRRRVLSLRPVHAAPQRPAGHGRSSEPPSDLIDSSHSHLHHPCTMQLENENRKLKYQCLHLKKAVVEGDEKLAALQGGK